MYLIAFSLYLNSTPCQRCNSVETPDDDYVVAVDIDYRNTGLYLRVLYPRYVVAILIYCTVRSVHKTRPICRFCANETSMLQKI